MHRPCEKCGAKRTYTPGPSSRWSKHTPKSDKTHTLCNKCWRALRTSTAPKSKSYTATRPGRPISELESIHDPGPGAGRPWPELVNKILVAMGVLEIDVAKRDRTPIEEKELAPAGLPEVR